MAKIILVSPKVNATTWQLARALRAQQHEVVLLTSFGESVPDDGQVEYGIEFMAYFKRWSLIEGLRIIPGLFGLQAQILHLLLAEDKLNPAQAVLATFAKSHPNCILTTSLLHIRRNLGRRNPVRYLIEESDIITCPTVETLGELRGLSVRSRRQGRGILPPVLDLAERAHHDQDELNLEISEAEQKIAAILRAEDFVVVPFNEKRFDREADYFLRLRILAQKYLLVLNGSHRHWSLRERKQFETWMDECPRASEKHSPSRWLVTGERISTALSAELWKNAQVVVLAGLPLTPVQLTDHYLQAIQNQASLVIDSVQAGVHSSLWKNGVNCWILKASHVSTELVKLLERGPDEKPLKLSEGLPAHFEQQRHWLDHPLNELNRLYARALEMKN